MKVRAGRGSVVVLGRRRIEVSNPDKVLFPEDGITKADLVAYYADVAPHLLRHAGDRPIAMERYPDGIDRQRIFQKDVPGYFPDWISRVRVEKRGGFLHQVVLDAAATLAYLANQACITPHTFLSKRDRLDVPDQLMFDLDPPDDGFELARQVALDVRGLLEDELRLPAFAKTTGGKGLHVVVPLRRSAGFDEVRTFARDVARILERRMPDRVTTEQRKVKRDGRLFLDLMRNAYAQTAVPPYAVRARPGAPVATPLSWDEVRDPRLRPDRFTVATVSRRLARTTDPWSGMSRRARSLGDAGRRLARILEAGD